LLQLLGSDRCKQQKDENKVQQFHLTAYTTNSHHKITYEKIPLFPYWSAAQIPQLDMRKMPFFVSYPAVKVIYTDELSGKKRVLCIVGSWKVVADRQKLLIKL